MAPTIGFTFLLLVIFSSLLIPLYTFSAHKKIFFTHNTKRSEKIIKFFLIQIFVCALFSQLSLIYSYIISDYSVANVYYNSHALKPLIYRISGSWGNHEGSMLLLITILSFYNLAFTFIGKNSAKEKLITISSQSLILAGIALFTALTSSPFERIFPTPIEGLGLNPILQDIGLAMHPPTLYLGYIGFSLIFSLAIAGLLQEKIDQKFAANMKIWLSFSLAILTAGIGLGSWWAYRELGWGGYWFWDPVENISLMPWIAGLTLLHCTYLLEKKNQLKLWTALLSIISFILCLLGIFLVRSGILTSVHSFAVDAKRGFFIILLIFLIGGIGLLIFAFKAMKIKAEEQNKKTEFLSKTTMILFNNYFLVLALLIVVLGTLYPIFSDLIFDTAIATSASYYNEIFSIIIVPFLAILLLSYYLKFPKFLAAIFAVIALISYFQTNFDRQLFSILLLAIFVFCGIVFSLILNRKYFWQNISSNLAHGGFILIILGVMTTAIFAKTKEINIQENQTTKISNYEIKFKQVDYYAASNYIARQGIFEITKNNKFYTILKPELRYFPVSDQTTYEAAIKNGIFGDLYLVLGNKDEQEFYALRIYYKPFIYLIWLGCFMITIGILSRIPLASKKMRI